KALTHEVVGRERVFFIRGRPSDSPAADPTTVVLVSADTRDVIDALARALLQRCHASGAVRSVPLRSRFSRRGDSLLRSVDCGVRAAIFQPVPARAPTAGTTGMSANGASPLRATPQ